MVCMAHQANTVCEACTPGGPAGGGGEGGGKVKVNENQEMGLINFTFSACKECNDVHEFT